ncbi:lysine-sensitive aspartokinase 3 [Candidatus Pantoea edessiphila]|uniref:Aspartokinase n=1 Tax=Candidatus Pantoea edessiphila TaxID=2044610 RepID=A0A2P5SW37_9GAMM|nr:lysine-sensitive aspartokinase 3 [Candidatus Pantoea edessiphila]PPI86526.1 lysine-sensitive aspartokinase 3 [Candidatus Pantoea edessiphila]
MVQKLVVAKFGGTSVADFNAMNRSANVIINDPNTRLVVLSASATITNILISLSEGKNKLHRSLLIKKITDIQDSIIYQLKKNKQLHKLINKMITTIAILAKNASVAPSKELKDEIVSYGELISTLIFVEILREKKIDTVWFDIRKVMKTNNNFGCAQPDINILSCKVKKYLEPIVYKKIIVTQGFIGLDDHGRTTTLGRGGSDYTATLLGEALRATRVDIWTDVPGIYTTDPRLVSTAKRIDEITFKEAAEMAIYGAKILHPFTLLPVVRSDIPVFVSSSHNPEAGGTYIINKNKHLPLFRALTLRNKQIMLTMRKLDQYNQTNFLAKIFNILLNHDISVDILTSSETSLALIINNSFEVNVNDFITNEFLAKVSSFCQISIEENLSLISIIGNNLSKALGIRKKIFEILEPFNLRMVYYDVNNCNICFVVSSIDSEYIIRTLHHNLFE